MKNYPKILDIILTASLTLTIIGSFFIIKDLYIGSIQIPQSFYFFLAIALITIGLKIRSSTEYREVLTTVWKKYRFAIIIFFSFIIINLIFYIFTRQANDPLPFFLVDLCRVIAVIILSIIIIVHLTINKKAYYWLTVAFFIPLILTPLLFFRDVDKIKNLLPMTFFSGYSLQAMQDLTTGLGVWLVITFAFLVSFLFKKIRDRKFISAIISGLGTIITTSLIWWTNSRGALLAAILIFVIIGFISYKREKLKLAFVLLSLFILLTVSLYILPPQAKANVFVRYYPQYRQEVTNNNFKISSLSTLLSKSTQNINQTGVLVQNTPAPVTISTQTSPPVQDVSLPAPKPNQANTSAQGSLPTAPSPDQVKTQKVFLPIPDFTNEQDRQNIWPEHMLYVLNHPLGVYGPEIVFASEQIGLEKGGHNTLLQVGKWGGWGSLVIILLFILYIFKLSYGLIKKHNDDSYIIGLTMSFFGIFILSMLNSFIALKTFWILPAMIIAYALQREDNLSRGKSL